MNILTDRFSSKRLTDARDRLRTMTPILHRRLREVAPAAVANHRGHKRPSLGLRRGADIVDCHVATLLEMTPIKTRVVTQ